MWKFMPDGWRTMRYDNSSLKIAKNYKPCYIVYINSPHLIDQSKLSRKIKMATRPLIGWDIFDFSFETAVRNSTKLDRSQKLNILYQVCVFRADRKNKMAALASDWLRHFQLLLWNCWTEFNETSQQARSISMSSDKFVFQPIRMAVVVSD